MTQPELMPSAIFVSVHVRSAMVVTNASVVLIVFFFRCIGRCAVILIPLSVTTPYRAILPTLHTSSREPSMKTKVKECNKGVALGSKAQFQAVLGVQAYRASKSVLPHLVRTREVLRNTFSSWEMEKNVSNILSTAGKHTPQCFYGGVFAQRAHSASYYGVYPGNSPENLPPLEACMSNSKVRNSNGSCSENYPMSKTMQCRQ